MITAIQVIVVLLIVYTACKPPREYELVGKSRHEQRLEDTARLEHELGMLHNSDRCRICRGGP